MLDLAAGVIGRVAAAAADVVGQSDAATQAPQSGADSLPSWVAIIIALGGSIGIQQAWSFFGDWRKRRSEARKVDAEGTEVDTRAEVALSGQALLVSEHNDRRVREAWAAADDARQRATAAEDSAAQCRRDRDNDRERLTDIEREMARFRRLVLTSCVGCPVADQMRNDDA